MVDPLLKKLFYYESGDIYTDEDWNRLWEIDHNSLLNIVFFLRSHRKFNGIIGKGDRKIFHNFIRWMSFHKKRHLLYILPYIPDCGYWKDLYKLLGTPVESEILDFISTQLLKDYMAYNRDPPQMISLCAKWVPNENSSIDKEFNFYSKLCNHLNKTKRELRKDILVPLRRYLNVTEQLITAREWDNINYEFLSERSLRLHKLVFEKHDPYRFREFMNRRVLSDRLSISKGHNSNEDLIIAVDVTGSMKGKISEISRRLVKNIYIPFDIYAEKRTDLKYQHVSNFNEEIHGYNIENCIELAHLSGKRLLLFISNINIDISEIANEDIHIIYWHIKDNYISIVDRKKLTIISGFDEITYRNIAEGNFINSDIYYQLVTQEMVKLPILS